MRYRVLSLDQAIEFADSWVRAPAELNPTDVDAKAQLSGSGPDFNSAGFSTLVDDWNSLITRFEDESDSDARGRVTVHPSPGRDPVVLSSMDQLEGWLAVELYEWMKDFDEGVLDHPGFWRYLSLRFGWSLISWRESKAIANATKEGSKNPFAYRTYVNALNSYETVLTRMFIRGRLAAGAEGNDSIAWAALSATDLWRSHIVRVKTGYSAVLTQAVVESQVEEPMVTDPLREFAKRLNRLSSNVLLLEYELEGARTVVEELRAGMEGWVKSEK